MGTLVARGSQDLERDENLGQGKDLLFDGEDVLVANALSGLEEIVDGKKGMAEEASIQGLVRGSKV